MFQVASFSRCVSLCVMACSSTNVVPLYTLRHQVRVPSTSKHVSCPCAVAVHTRSNGLFRICVIFPCRNPIPDPRAIAQHCDLGGQSCTWYWIRIFEYSYEYYWPSNTGICTWFQYSNTECRYEYSTKYSNAWYSIIIIFSDGYDYRGYLTKQPHFDGAIYRVKY